ncbi:MAG: Ig-like domain-containing protein, partial [Phycisphaeraceae bacterium]|nr:Ig-like domain-containing protein [Phycisphaeraceae bacterium]
MEANVRWRRAWRGLLNRGGQRSGYSLAEAENDQIRATGLELLEPRLLLSAGPQVVGLAPQGSPYDPFSTLRVEFDRPIDVSTFTTDDVQLTRPGGAASPQSVAAVDDTHFDITFADTSTSAVYSLRIGPDILGLADHLAMDQDDDGLPGEADQDVYQARLVTATTTIGEADFQFDHLNLMVYGSTLTINGPHDLASLAVLGGANVTHSPTTTDHAYSLELHIDGSLWIDAASRIDVSGRGYTISHTLGNTTAGAAQRRAGGSYGGFGTSSDGSINAVYGDYRDPHELGSGGGDLWGGGGFGGGLVRIIAGSAVVDGQVLADGGIGSYYARTAGSGGGIRLDVGTLSGTGKISASGGFGYADGGSGGGGRVAVYYDTLDFEKSNLWAIGGQSDPGRAAAGTIYLNDRGSGAGELRIDSHDAPGSFTTPLGLPTDTVFEADHLVITGQNAFAAPEHQMEVHVNRLSLLAGGVLTHRYATTTETFSLVLTVSDLLKIDTDSRIDVSNRGHLIGYTDGNTTTGAADRRAGGSYGGYGSSQDGATNAVYGDYRDPNELGGGGGALWGQGGSGGGLVRISADFAVIDGQILADGGSGWYYGRTAGSGGGIRLDVGTLSGTGKISASGGFGYGDGGSGGGGRVAIYYDTSSFAASQVWAVDGYGSDPGAAAVGSVYLKDRAGVGELRYDSHGQAVGVWTPLGIADNVFFEADRLVVRGAGVVAAPEHQMEVQVNSLSLESGGVLTHRVATTAEVYSLLLTVLGELSIDADSRIDVSNRGHLIGYTDGTTTTGAADRRAGGSFGGYGSSQDGATNAVYGDYHDPDELGAGGGALWGQGGSGGGLVRISAGSAIVNGQILANGGSGWYYGRTAGSGGGIRLDVGTLSGTGTIAANGGNGYGDGGSGGGGRVAIYYQTLAMATSQLWAIGGRGSDPGAASVGTIYLHAATGHGELRIDGHDVTSGVWTALGIAGDAEFMADDLVIRGTGVVVAPEHQMPVSVNNLAILDGAVLTHRITTTTDAFSLLVTVAEQLTVDVNSRIDVSNRGYTWGHTVGNDTATAAVSKAGGTYGGYGTSNQGTTNVAYDDYRDPANLGSGGGTAWGAGGSGGGLIRITAASAFIDGQILANGGGGWYYGRVAGSGGGIRLDVGSLSGSGLIEANGGNGYGDGGAGGGGRVAIYYDTIDFAPTQVWAVGGHDGDAGAAGVGTVYLKDRLAAGELRLDSQGQPSGVWTPLGVTGDGLFEADRLVIRGNGVVAAPEHQMEVHVNRLSLENGAALTHRVTTAEKAFTLLVTVTGELSIDAASRIDVSNRGYTWGHTVGNDTATAAASKAGGSYGGYGASTNGATNAAYDDYRDPANLGSGGGTTWGAGGSGGGLVRISAGSAFIDGQVLADGGSGSYYARVAGSGGGIRLDVGTLSGSGAITANGGGGYGDGGAGGGGRVAIYYDDISGFDPSKIMTLGGTGGDAGAGAVGTVYLKDRAGAGELRIDSHGASAGVWTPLGVADDSVFAADRLVIHGPGVVVAPEHQMPILAQNVSLFGGAVLTHRYATADQTFSLLMNVSGSLVIDATSRIDVSNRGYLIGRASGNGTDGAATGAMGGSYGGLGWGAPVGNLYGSAEDPNEPGAGGGTNWGQGGSGGGLLRITAGDITLDGQILANGGDGYYSGRPAGSGGGIRLDVGTLAGSGTIAANGGTGYSEGGSGGGGRVAVYYWGGLTLPGANISVAGGGSGRPGQAGTLHVELTEHDTAPPVVVSHQPSGAVGQPVSSLIVQFNEAVDVDSFTGQDVTLTLPDGSTLDPALIQVVSLDVGRFEILWPALAVHGAYTLVLGPDIADLAGNVMSAAYLGAFSIDLIGPRVTDLSPAGQVHQALEYVDVTFDSPIDVANFVTTQASLITPGGSTVAVTSVEQLTGTTFRLHFARQTAPGSYQFRVGPGVTDLVGNPMDQDADGINGKAVDDVFSATLTVLFPELSIDSLGLQAGPTAVGQSIQVNWTVRNSGNQPATANWIDALYLSLDDVLDGSDVLLAKVSIDAQTPLAAGATYTIGRTVTLPMVQPGAWKLLLRVDHENLQDETDEANNAASAGITLSAPDLTVTLGSLPTWAAVGQEVSVTWTVRNSGAVQAVTDWTDVLYLSLDDQVSGDDVVLLSQAITTQTPLTADGSYTLVRKITIPKIASGGWKLLVKTDAGNAQVETDELNNLAVASIEVRLANLVTEVVTAPAVVYSGQSAEIAWRVRNIGNGVTSGATWTDRVYLSFDDILGDDITLGSFAYTVPVPLAGLAAGQSYSQVRSVTIPEQGDVPAGNYWVFVVTDANENVSESDETDNAGRTDQSVQLVLSPVPDLAVTGVAIAPAGVVGQTAEVSWTVTNVGQAATGDSSWIDRVYLSADGSLEGAVLLATYFGGGSLAAGASYVRSENLALPSLADASYRLVVVTDATGQVYERDAEANNIAPSDGEIVLKHTDLRVEEVRGPPTTTSGTNILVSWTVRNDGTGDTPGGSGAWLDRIYLSTTQQGGGGGTDVLLGEVTHSGLVASGGSYDAQLTVKLPRGAEGTYYLRVVTDAGGAVIEPDGESNNQASSAAMAVTLAPYADLHTSSVTTNAALLVGDPVDLTVTWTVKNLGTGSGDVSSWFDRIVLSTDETYGNGDDREIGRFAHDGLVPVNASYTQTQIIALAAATQGRFYVFVKADVDDAVYEHADAQPNVGRTDATIDVTPKPYADLVVDVVVSQDLGSNGLSISVQWTVSNQGIGVTDTPNWSDQVRLTTDPSGAGTISLDSFTHAGALAPGSTYTRTVEAILPNNLPGGTYYVFVTTGGPYEFLYTANNTTRAQDPLTVLFIPPPQGDLRVTTVTGPTAALDAQTAEISWTVRNNGPDSIDGNWVDRILLAPNGNLAQAVSLGDFTRVGGLESGKTYSRTEVVRLPQTPGVYRIVVITDVGNATAEADETNNTTLAEAGLTLSVSPRPDLQVISATGPATVTAGGVIDVEWVVSNLGPVKTPTGGSRWTDAIFLSMDHALGGGDIALGTLANGSALAPGESYGSSLQSLRLPNGVSGNVFIIVAVDVAIVNGSPVPGSTGVVDEYTAEGNNYFAIPLAVDAIPVPPPDLVVTSVSGPIDAFDDTTITVRYRVENRGPGVTGRDSWTDSIWLSTTRGRPYAPLIGSDIILGSFGHSGALQPGQYYDAQVTVRLPAHTAGKYFLTVWTDAGDAVYEAALDVNLNPDSPNDLQSSNFKATPITVMFTPPADLEVTSVIAPAAAVGGQNVTLTWTVANNGSAVTDKDQWADAIYISTDDDLYDGHGESWLVFATPHYGALAVGQSYTQELTFTLPPSASGAYFIVETNVDPMIAMTDEELFLKQVQEIVNRAAEVLGHPLTEVTYDDLSKLTKADIMYILVGPPQAQSTRVFESTLTDNNQRAAASVITNLPADLVVSDVTIAASVDSGTTATISWKVTNVGGDTWSGTTHWADYVFFSPDPTFLADRASLVARVVHAGGLASGQSYTATAQVPIPAGIEGKRYVHVFSDIELDRYGKPITPGELSPGTFPSWPEHFQGRVWELGPKVVNTASALTHVVYREPDLTVTSLLIAEGAAVIDSGGYVTVRWTVKNQGNAPTRVGTWYDRVFISQDTSLDLYDEILGTFRHEGVVQADDTYEVTGTIRLPDDIDGPFYILVYIDSPFDHDPETRPLPYPSTQGGTRLRGQGDGYVQEFRGEGNDITSQTVNVHLVHSPDLRVSDVQTASHVLTGQSFVVTYYVGNVGPGGIPDRQNKWTDMVYLSRDQYLDIYSDHLVSQSGLVHKGILAVGDGYDVTAEFRLPRGITGPYYVFVVTDVPDALHPRGYVYEGANEANNTAASLVPMLIDLPPPADLVVQSVTGPAVAAAGQTVVISWTVQNASTQDLAGFWADSVYLSADAVWDWSDKLIGTADSYVNTDGTTTIPAGYILPPRLLAAGASYTAQITAKLPIVLPAGYRLIVRTDVFDDIHEGASDANNKTTSADTLEITVDTLELGTTYTDPRTGLDSRLYRVMVPAGQTLEVSALSAVGQLYVRYEALPDAIRYDAGYTGYAGGSPKVRVPTTQGGYYYIAVRGASGTVKLQTRLVPLSIASVSPDTGGDDRYVTTTIHGARFDHAAVVKLVRPRIGEFEPVAYEIVDATTIIATFDLRDAPRGLYDVRVTNPDGQSVTAPYRFLVEKATPYDVTVGLGGPGHLEPGSVGIYGLSLYNLSNVDVPYVYVQFGVPRVANKAVDLIPGEALTFSGNLTGSPSLLGIDWADVDPLLNLGGQLTNSGFVFDLRNQGYAGLTFTVDAYPELRRLLAEDPKFLENLSDEDLEALSFEFYIQASATPMSVDEYLDWQRDVAESLRPLIVADDNAPAALKLAASDAGAWADLYLSYLTSAGLLRSADVPAEIADQGKVASRVASAMAALLGGDGGAQVIADGYGDLSGLIDQVRTWLGNNPDAYGSETLPDLDQYNLNLSHTTHAEAFVIRVYLKGGFEGVKLDDQSSKDPGLAGYLVIGGATRSGDIFVTAPSGASDANYVPVDTTLPYLIGFKNSTDATSAVKQIRLVTQIDPNLDKRRFALGQIRLGDTVVDLPSLSALTTEYDYSDSLGFVL